MAPKADYLVNISKKDETWKVLPARAVQLLAQEDDPDILVAAWEPAEAINGELSCEI